MEGHSLFQDSELFTLLEAKVPIVRGLIAVQGDNQVICKDKDRGCQGELPGRMEFRSHKAETRLGPRKDRV